jgi:hypothetical protein
VVGISTKLLEVSFRIFATAAEAATGTSHKESAEHSHSHRALGSAITATILLLGLLTTAVTNTLTIILPRAAVRAGPSTSHEVLVTVSKDMVFSTKLCDRAVESGDIRGPLKRSGSVGRWSAFGELTEVADAIG